MKFGYFVCVFQGIVISKRVLCRAFKIIIAKPEEGLGPCFGRNVNWAEEVQQIVLGLAGKMGLCNNLPEGMIKISRDGCLVYLQRNELQR